MDAIIDVHARLLEVVGGDVDRLVALLVGLASRKVSMRGLGLGIRAQWWGVRLGPLLWINVMAAEDVGGLPDDQVVD